MNTLLLNQTAKEVVMRSILAADESTATIKKRFAAINIESTPEINRQYRQLLFTAPDIEKYVSGVILYDETIRQSTEDGIPFPQLLAKKGIVPGIKVDRGIEKFPGFGSDTFTKGFDKLSKRLVEYRELGARFAKWRAVYKISPGRPDAITALHNASDLALYASLCQDADIVPIVEPEVLMDGDHTFERCAQISSAVISMVMKKLKDYKVDLSGIILKPNMVTSGTVNKIQKSPNDVAKMTLEVLVQNVPAEVPGIAFLSGGQSPDLATEHLRIINEIKKRSGIKFPWRITASYGRALQGEAIRVWAGKKRNIKAAQKIFISRAEKVYKASLAQI